MGPNSQLESAVAKRKLKKHKVTSPFRSFLSSACFSTARLSAASRALPTYAATICTKLSGLHYSARGCLVLYDIPTLKMCNYSVFAIVYYANITFTPNFILPIYSLINLKLIFFVIKIFLFLIF